jgi:hypothetical protein
MVRLKGLEPLTLGSEDRCSIQLSYRRSRNKISRTADESRCAGALTLRSRSSIRCPEVAHNFLYNQGHSRAIGPLAQMDRATAYEAVGRVFESPRARHSTLQNSS